MTPVDEEFSRVVAQAAREGGGRVWTHEVSALFPARSRSWVSTRLKAAVQGDRLLGLRVFTTPNLGEWIVEPGGDG